MALSRIQWAGGARRAVEVRPSGIAMASAAGSVLFVGAFVALLAGGPIANHLWIRAGRKRALTDWEGLGEWAARSERVLQLVALRSDAKVQVEARVISLGHGRSAWRTTIGLDVPPTWGSGVAYYGRDAIGRILGFRRRIEIDDDFDREVLVRRVDEESQTIATSQLSDESFRTKLREAFANAPAVAIEDGRVSIERRGLPRRAALERDLDAVASLHGLLAGANG